MNISSVTYTHSWKLLCSLRLITQVTARARAAWRAMYQKLGARYKVMKQPSMITDIWDDAGPRKLPHMFICLIALLRGWNGGVNFAQFVMGSIAALQLWDPVPILQTKSFKHITLKNLLYSSLGGRNDFGTFQTRKFIALLRPDSEISENLSPHNSMLRQGIGLSFAPSYIKHLLVGVFSMTEAANNWLQLLSIWHNR